jgi:hypothetical protein
MTLNSFAKAVALVIGCSAIASAAPEAVFGFECDDPPRLEGSSGPVCLSVVEGEEVKEVVNGDSVELKSDFLAVGSEGGSPVNGGMVEYFWNQSDGSIKSASGFPILLYEGAIIKLQNDGVLQGFSTAIRVANGAKVEELVIGESGELLTTNSGSTSITVAGGHVGVVDNKGVLKSYVLVSNGTLGEFYNYGTIKPDGVYQDYIEVRSASLGEFVNYGDILFDQSGSGWNGGFYVTEGSSVDAFRNFGSIHIENKAVHVKVKSDYTGESLLGEFMNFGEIVSFKAGGVHLGSAKPVENFLNYGLIKVGSGNSVTVADGGISVIQVSPSSEFVVGDLENSDQSFSWDETSSAGLEKIILAGKEDDGVGDADEMSTALLGGRPVADFKELKTWQVGAGKIDQINDKYGNPLVYDDNDVVWEFGGQGGYADKDDITIDIVRGTAKLTSDQGFGKYFDSSNIGEEEGEGDVLSKVIVRKNGTLDLNRHAPTISDITLKGGAGSGTVQQIMANTATIQSGALTGTITSSGGLLSDVSGADLNVKSGRTFLRDGTSLGTVEVTGGQLWTADDDPVTVANLTLNTDPFRPDDRRNAGRTLTSEVQDGLVLGFDDDADAALKVADTFTYEGGNVYLYKPAEAEANDYEGTWNVIDFKEGDLSDAGYQKLFANTYLMYETPEGDLEYFKFAADGSSADADLIREVSLKKGSLKVVVGGAEISGDQEKEIESDIEDDVLGGSGSASGGGSIDFDDNAFDEIADEFELWTRDELIEVVKRGLLPRNVDGAGQTLATYNNLLADTIFERTPMRQFTEVEPEVAVEPTPEPEVVPAGEPVRGLWAKSGEVNEAEANAYLDEATATSQPLVVADAHTAAEHEGEHLIEINGKTYAENDSLTAEYAERDGVRGWFRGFGGQSADSNGESGTLFNHYSISSGGGVVGVDVSLSESFQIGAYANYGNINLWQRNGVEGLSGSWEADGWGGGVTADYWTNNFYVQGLIGGTGFSGEQKRAVKGYANYFDDETASGEKSAGSMVGALRVGAPFQSGSTYFEPQFTATWTGNSENRFSESADDDRLGLTYKSRNTNYLQTALGMKLAWPIKTGTTGLLTPSVKVAWLGDWNQNNADQRIGFDFTDKTYSVSSNQEDVNGALLEAGLDYSVAQVEGTTVKAYVRGGAEMWGGSRGTQWRASGGVTFQF